ncbi:DUF1439 domain-containing protein [Alteromonas oceanisediminis]|uniref:DUF1439 domain-containing protein n=1 Tax=Alteromonas oceanisediminis TaxID=2836180 RepID=UPI001BDB1F4E|nr:DUF1439 domain-containing protein [Alteromonas oceanisediminis]MBT0587446.1 DUF1439 domain-containing protein [Alteromonas oceanisediminis]
MTQPLFLFIIKASLTNAEPPLSIPWQTLSLSDRCKVAIAMLLVKLGKLKYDQFSEAELNALIVTHFPQSMPLPVPVGKGRLTLITGELFMPKSTNRLELNVLCGLEIRVMGNPIYRAHVNVVVSAEPLYIAQQQLLSIDKLRVDSVALINDEYALLSDTTRLIDSLSPVQLSGFLGAPLKSALNVISGGTSNSAINYLKLYVGGSKQRILDYHREHIEDHIIATIANENIHTSMSHDDWRQNLFARLGKRVVVEERELRFYF